MSQKLFLLACKEGGGGESSRKWSSLLTNGKEIFVMGRPPGPSAPANRTVGTVAGVIDGKCEHGYLVTATVGTQKLRGVLFHPVEECVNQAANVSAESESSNVRVVCRRHRRKKLSKRDPKHPKPNRSGYNFFFSEQCARLKPLHPGCDREISKIIGDLWNKLTETEKAVYQENGVKDKERYKSEMAVYEEQRKTGPVISDDVQIQHRPPEPVGVMADADSKMVIDKRGLPEGDENGTGSDNSSETKGKDSDLSSGWEGFELRRRDGLQVGAEADHPSSSEESKKVSEPSIYPK